MNVSIADATPNRLFAVVAMVAGMVSGLPWSRNANSRKRYSLVSIVSQASLTYFKLTENQPMLNLIELTRNQQRCARLAMRCKNTMHVARLWNWADHQHCADDYFDIIYETCSRYFVGDVLVDSNDDAGTLTLYDRNPRRFN